MASIGLTPRTSRLTANLYRFFFLFQGLFCRFLVDNFFSSFRCSVGGRASLFFETSPEICKLVGIYNSGFLQPGGVGGLSRVARVGVSKTSFCIFGIGTVEMLALICFLTVAQRANFRLTSLQSPFFASWFCKQGTGAVYKTLLPSIHFNEWSSFRLLAKVDYLSNNVQFPSRIISLVVLQLVVFLQITVVLRVLSLSFCSHGN